MSIDSKPNKYQRWLDAALNQLNQDFLNGKFQPDNESDIKCHLYHSFLITKDHIEGLEQAHVLTEFKVLKTQQRIDLAIVKQTRLGYEPRLLLEIKETRKSDRSPDDIERRVSGDIDKLRMYKKNLDKSKVVYSKSLRRLVVYFFFRGAVGTSIGMETNRKMESLQKTYTDVDLQWGPR